MSQSMRIVVGGIFGGVGFRTILTPSAVSTNHTSVISSHLNYIGPNPHALHESRADPFQGASRLRHAGPLADPFRSSYGRRVRCLLPLDCAASSIILGNTGPGNSKSARGGATTIP